MVSDLHLLELPKELEALSDSSRVWIYQAERRLTKDESFWADMTIKQFAKNWTSHNRDLKGFGGVIKNVFLVIVLDQEASSQASGCSIDALVHTIEDMGRELQVDFMDRMLFYFQVEDQIEGIHMQQLADAYAEGRINDDTLVYDNLVSSKSKLLQDWLKPLKDSWHIRFVRKT
jgi:hypothetical protein